MPESEFPKLRPHPFKKTIAEQKVISPPSDAPLTAYAELAVTSNFTFLTGASHPEEFAERAAALGHRAIAITDTNTLAGIVRAHIGAKEAGMRLIVGCRLRLAPPDAMDILVYPTTRAAYAGLCQLLTLGKRRAPKGECHLHWEDVAAHNAGLLAIAMPLRDSLENLLSMLAKMLAVFNDDRLSLAICRAYGPDDAADLAHTAAMAACLGIPLVAINDVHYHAPQRRPLQDVLTCIRHGCTIEDAGFRLHANAERHLKPPDEIARLFAAYPDAIERTIAIADRAGAFSLDELRYEYPVEPCPPGLTPMAYLTQCTWEGAAKRYPTGVPSKVHKQLEYELSFIEELRYEAYFLTCFDIVEFARGRGILCQGRGGAANSAVCYCLGITEIDPARFTLLFERFVSRARGEPPDIDIDFEHERREEVIQYLYNKYGRDRAALTAEAITYRGRSAVRDVGKAMGLSLDIIDTLAKNLDRWREGPSDQRIEECGVNPHDPLIRRVITLTRQLIGFPRHLSQHVGGFVITRSPLCELVPIENAAMEDRTVIEWDKDDIDAMGMLKVDVLGLGMLTCIRKAFELVEQSTGRPLTIATVPPEDPDVYDMICRADTVGVFQIESRAQMSMLPRLKPREFYDLVIEVAIVRPGPIQGKMVHPYLRRRNKEEAFTYPSRQVEEVLGRTLGVPLFQEQAMQLSIVTAGFTPDEADQLRRAMAAWRRKGDKMAMFGGKLIAGMLRNGYPRDFAERCFEQIKGFSEYGFPESHAASFALLVYVSCWLKHHHPAAFAAALINSQPMGFYAPAQIVRDAQQHNVEVRPIDVNCSTWDCTMESSTDDPSRQPALRLGMRLVKGLQQADADRIAAAVLDRGAFTSVASLWRASDVAVRSLRCLAHGDAFRSMHLDRQAALWQIRPLRNDRLPLFEQLESSDANSDAETDGLDSLPPVTPAHHMLQDYDRTGLSLKAHPLSFIRAELDSLGITATANLRDARLCRDGSRIAVAGVVLVRQRPGTASGVVFITLEDETGIANLILWSDTFEKFRRVARLSTTMLARGRVQREGLVVHIHVDHLESLDDRMPSLASISRDFH